MANWSIPGIRHWILLTSSLSPMQSAENTGDKFSTAKPPCTPGINNTNISSWYQPKDSHFHTLQQFSFFLIPLGNPHLTKPPHWWYHYEIIYIPLEDIYSLISVPEEFYLDMFVLSLFLCPGFLLLQTWEFLTNNCERLLTISFHNVANSSNEVKIHLPGLYMTLKKNSWWNSH